MKKQLLLLFCLLTFLGLEAMAQQRGSVQGTLTDALSNAPLVGVNVVARTDKAGALPAGKGSVTDVNGRYQIQGLPDGEYTLSISSVGYAKAQRTFSIKGGNSLQLDHKLQESAMMLEEAVVVSGSMRAEKLTETPATIQVITADDIAGLPTFNPGELLARQKGVDYVRSGVVGTGINVRGFNSNFNAKNLQVTDGRFSTLIATGLPFGPLNTVIKEDIERVEVVLGPNAALFGPNAHNGLVNTITKDPRISAGTTVALGLGNQSTFSARLRHAQVLGDKLAFKVTGEYTRGKEFDYVDSVYVDTNLDGKKEAYEELELDRNFEFLRGEASAIYSPISGMDITLSGGGSNSTYLAPTNAGRNQIKDWRIFYTHAKLKYKGLFAQVYHTWSKTDDTYAINTRTAQYRRLLAAGVSDAEARGERSYATGARFVDDSRRLNAELQYHATFWGFDGTIGTQYQRDLADSKNTYLLQGENGDPIQVDQVGVYGQLERKMGKFKAVAAFRADNHQVYGFNFLPKLGLVYNLTDQSALRLTYGKGIAAPTILNLYGNLFSGLILGNAEGFTRADGSVVDRQRVEKLSTVELGYKGSTIPGKLYLDANAYYNRSEDFLSPLSGLGVVSKRGNTPIQQVQSGYAIWKGAVSTYVNFGQFDTYGADLSATYYFIPQLSATFNYSYFGYAIDEKAMENDINKDKVVNELDLMVNAPKHKASLALNMSHDRFFGSIFTRWVQAYNYYSGIYVAAATNRDLKWRGVPIVEDARGADAFNYGPLGGFVNVDVSLGYKVNKWLTASAQVTNLFDAEVREFTASPVIGRLYSLELRVNIPALSAK